MTTRKRTGVVKLRKVVPNPKQAYNSRETAENTSEMFYIEVKMIKYCFVILKSEILFNARVLHF